jgi:hypothetical protein
MLHISPYHAPFRCINVIVTLFYVFKMGTDLWLDWNLSEMIVHTIYRPFNVGIHYMVWKGVDNFYLGL